MEFFFTGEHPALCFRHRGARGDMRRVVVTRLSYDIGADGSLSQTVPPPGLNLREVGFGDVLVTPPRFESDLAPEKASVDLIVHAHAHAPRGRAVPRFEVALTAHLGDRRLVERSLTVTGPREWRRGALGWSLSEPEPAVEVPLRFDRAYGGTVRLDDPRDRQARPLTLAHPDNPVGCGFVPTLEGLQRSYGLDGGAAKAVLDAWLDRHDRLEAPQIELPGRPLRALHEPYPLAGWGLVAKHWALRHRHAGTFDEAWMRQRHPALPVDFDPRYWNGAHPDLQLDDLAPGATIELLNLVPASRASHQALRVQLPDVRPTVRRRVQGHGGPEILPMRLDTVMIDLLDDRLTLLYRLDVPDEDGLAYLSLMVT